MFFRMTSGKEIKVSQNYKKKFEFEHLKSWKFFFLKQVRF